MLTTTATADEEPQPLAQRMAWWQVHLRESMPVFVAEMDEQLVGWSSLSRYHPRVAYRFTAEDSIYISPEFRGRGIGRALLSPLLARAQTMGLHAVVALITAENEASLRLHRALGFEQVGHLPEVLFKFGRWLDLALLQRTFGAREGQGPVDGQ
ncbi:MAG: N-acetyltransferase family protein [Armatimonadetes bacterium]|nr:N-acetyltransferase family protein [Armatimonadota bacterium]